MCNLYDAIYEGGSVKTDEELNAEYEHARKQMDCDSCHCSGCPYQ